ncbi:MAG: hypothetical protein GY903_05920 [Fuerstiella sp.]|nr:hypothetical protein [Fuerstiella sp.]MCP4854011.1 hypothetical protein [Fuerstiella sp.]
MFARFSLATLAVLSLLTTDCFAGDSEKPLKPTVEPVIVDESMAVDASPVIVEESIDVDASPVVDAPKVKEHPKAGSYDEVLKLNPVGYWPADEGGGSVLHDRSGRGNHGQIRAVPWRDGFLDFENDVYQWVEVPYKQEFGSKNFSMGGWLYSGHDKSKEDSHIGAILIGQPLIKSGADNLKWGAIWGERVDSSGALLRYGTPKGKNATFLEVASGKQNDVAGSAKAETVVAHSKWQHLFYTYGATTGTGSVYLNGKRISSADNIPFDPMDTPLVIGGGRWGTFNLGGNASLDGTLRHITFFDRTLTPEEVAAAADLTHPPTSPVITPYSVRKATPEKAEPVFDLAQLIERVQNKQLDELSRGKAAVQLASMGKTAKPAIPVLVAELRQLIDSNGIHLPKIEEFSRNALIQALLSIDRNETQAQQILGAALIEPFLTSVGTKPAHFETIRSLVKSGQWFEALDAYKAHMASLPTLQKFPKWGSFDSKEAVAEHSRLFPLSAEYFDGYLSMNVPYADAGYSAYNIVDNTLDGYSYMTMYERVPFDEVEDQFDRHLKQNTGKRPGQEFSPQNGTVTRKWSRVQIVQRTPDGKRESVYLEGPWFIYDASDAKNDGWSIITDEKGYIHVWGGQHNSPNEDYYLPGIWPMLDMAEDEKAGVLYWVSKRPHDITEFEFLGKSNNPRRVSGWINYMNLTRSRTGDLFLYCRGHLWTWALHRYDTKQQRWTRIKGSARNMFNAAEKRNPEWSANLGNTVRYHGPADALVEAFQPGAYNFCRTWPHLTGNEVQGITFDLSNRMHICLPILGVGQSGRMTQGPVYAYSDDLGDTFYGAEGKRLALPLTVNPIPGHYADRTIEPARSHFEVWASLVREFD